MQYADCSVIALHKLSRSKRKALAARNREAQQVNALDAQERSEAKTRRVQSPCPFSAPAFVSAIENSADYKLILERSGYDKAQQYLTACLALMRLGGATVAYGTYIKSDNTTALMREATNALKLTPLERALLKNEANAE